MDFCFNSMFANYMCNFEGVCLCLGSLGEFFAYHHNIISLIKKIVLNSLSTNSTKSKLQSVTD